jgi:CRISPR-associated protein Cas1
MAQARFLADPQRQERLAMAIVRGRVRNQYLHLQRLNRSRHDADLAAGAVAIKRLAMQLPDRAPASRANGLEGNAARLYWPLYAKALAGNFAFSWQDWHRNRRPPPDPVNACLGYLSALLERDIRVAVERAGLHPGMGALHSAREGADALIYDLMEGFRAALPEAILATMIARSQIRPDMFVIRAERDEMGQENRSCRMEIVARRALIQGYESWLSRPVKSRRSGQRLLWRALMEEEARAMADCLLGVAEAFSPYEIDY